MRFVVIRRDTSASRPDGINIASLSLCSGLIQNGHEAIYVTVTADTNKKIEDLYAISQAVEHHSLLDNVDVTRKRAVALWYTRGRPLLRSLEPDVIVSNGLLPFPLPAQEVALTHDLEIFGRGPAWVRDAGRFVKLRGRVIPAATTSEIQSSLSSRLRRPVSLVPNGVDVVLSPTPRHRRRGDFIHVGTTRYKNPATSVRAFAEAGLDGARLLFIGPETPELAAAIKQCDAATRDKIAIMGFVSKDVLHEALRQASVVLVPSLYHTPVGSPTVLEAFASGTPVIASCVSSDVLEDGVNGFSISPEDAPAMSGLMRRLANSQDWNKLSENATATARRLSARHAADALLAVVGA